MSVCVLKAIEDRFDEVVDAVLAKVAELVADCPPQFDHMERRA